MSEELFLTLGSVFAYLNCNATSRCIVEGEEIVNSNHIILIGTNLQENEDFKNVIALCLQTSALKATPHEIKGEFIVESNKIVTIRQFSCTCKAGLSGTCKHISAVLLKCTRININALEKLSSTDLTCYWTAKKKTVHEEYSAKPLLETTCFAPKVKKTEDTIKPEAREEFFHKVLSVCSSSALALHLKGRTKVVLNQELSVELPKEIQQLIENMETSKFLDALDLNIEAYELKLCCREFYNRNISGSYNFVNCLLAPQKSSIWEKERKLRITGSRCYSLYTYAKDDWETKSKSYFWPKAFSNKYVEHGIKFEDEALNSYREANNYKIMKLGLVICKKYPWLAFSPDGIVVTPEGFVKLVEIKCPYEGINVDAINFVTSCAYLQISLESGITLKKNHQYYGQIQLGLAILNLPECDLILYSSKSKSFLNIIVPFDENFAKDLLLQISSKFLTKMLHFVCEKDK